ncbi:cytochrome P450 4V2-like [Ochlerotatus camptorhynchus]|uniref:cytochrome P450 4V2-like n=1 Tax=Ochlerotatus camptorhynchus TaxID=644619 RepID=UPI0031CF6422
MFLLLLLAIVGALLVVQYIKLLRVSSFAEKIPSFQPVYPVLGHIPLFWGKSTHEAFQIALKLFASAERVGKILLGPSPWIIINHPDLLQQILTRNEMYDKPFPYDFFRLGSGLITERSGERWLQAKKLLSPTFNTRMLTGFLPTMDARAMKMITKLQPLADGHTEIDLFQYISTCTLEIAFSTTMGRVVDELPGQQDYIRNLEIMMNAIGARIVNVNLWLFYRFSKTYQIDEQARNNCFAFTNKIIQERRRELRTEPESTHDEFLKKQMNTLDQIITAQRSNGTAFTDTELIYQLFSIMSAANDTSALTVAYTCLFLAMYPEIQDKVMAEMNQVFYSPEVEINLDTVKQLEYTEMVVKEVLRLCPAVPFGARQTSKEILIDDIRVPKDQIIAYDLYTLHRRKEFWGPDAELFDPERFRPEAVQQRHPYAYMPFYGGLRNCIGHRYAMLSVRIMLLRVLQNFELRTNLKQSDLKFKFEITLKLDGPHSVWLVKRNKGL